MDAWRPSTKKVYTTYVRKWAVFCITNNIKLLKPTVPQVCRFLRTLAARGLGYGALNAARSALSLILPHVEGEPIGKHPIVCWLIKGAYERNPPKPRYNVFWDVRLVFQMFKNWPDNYHLTLQQLSWKLTVLLLLVTSQRGQTILNLSVEQLDLGGPDRPVVFKMKRLLKHNKLGDPLDSVMLKRYPECAKLCVVKTLKRYLKQTKNIRQDDQLLIAYIKPHRAISRDTLARWTLIILQKAGIDTQKYKGHSTRGATTSAARVLGVPLNAIIRHAGWRNISSFAKFYNKNIESHTSVATAILQGGT